MTTGTTLVVFKQALRTRLSARAGLAGVTVGYAEPVVWSSDDNIWLGAATAAAELSAMRGGATFIVQEDYRLIVHLQAVRFTDDAQEAADVRAAELLRELQQELAETPQTIPEILIAEFAGWSADVDLIVEDGSGYGAKFDATVRVRARLT